MKQLIIIRHYLMAYPFQCTIYHPFLSLMYVPATEYNYIFVKLSQVITYQHILGVTCERMAVII